MLDLLSTHDVNSLFGRQVRAVCFTQGRGYSKVWVRQTGVHPPIRDRLAARESPSMQSVIVKARVVQVGHSAGSLQSHLRYLLRAGVARDSVTSGNDRGTFYNQNDRAEPRQFLEQAAGDYRHIRLVISIEQGACFADLRPVIRELMGHMQRDLQMPVEWLAVDHYNTAHPHSHIVMRPRNGLGGHQFVHPAYLKVTIRQRARVIVTREIGPAEPRPLVKAGEIATYHGPSGIDRLVDRNVKDGIWTLADVSPSNLEERSLVIDRVKTLQRLGLAEALQPQAFRLDASRFETLGRLDQRGRLFEILARELRVAGIEKAPAALSLFRNSPDQKPIVGRILAGKQLCRATDFMAVETIDGRVNHVPIGGWENNIPLTKGMIIKVTPRALVDEQEIDRTIAAVAVGNHGLYSRKLHQSFDRSARSCDLGKCERRLIHLAACGNAVQKISDIWCVGSQFLDRWMSFASRVRSPIIEVLSFEPLERLVTWRGATYLDRFDLGRLEIGGEHVERASRKPEPGLGQDLRRCLRARAMFLLELGLLKPGLGDARPYKELRRQELRQICRKLSETLDLPYSRPPASGELKGRCRGKIALASERLAVVERCRDFTIVRWSRAIEIAGGRLMAITIGGYARPGIERIAEDNGRSLRVCEVELHPDH
jgi:Protein of unknown function (DUF3363)